MKKRGTEDDVPGASIGETGSPCETEQQTQQQTLFSSRRSSPSIRHPTTERVEQALLKFATVPEAALALCGLPTE